MSEQPSIRLELPDEQGVAVVWIDQPDRKVNVLSTDLIPSFEAVLEQAQGVENLRSLVIASGKESGFIAGADIDMLGEADSAEAGAALSRAGQEVMNTLASLPIPSVAAIHGDCLGGGLELALACSARVVSDSPRTKLGLPEVMLGLLPGSGGTRRLPRLIGLPAALDMMLSGRTIRPKRAVKMGLADRMVPKNQLLSAARELASALAAGGKPPHRRRKRGFVEGLLDGVGRSLVYQQARKKVMGQTRGLMPAPLKILDVIRADSDAAEAEGFGALLMTPQSAGLRHLFDCITALKKDDGPDTEGLETAPAERVGILGAGLMGAGVAAVLADKGVHVRMKDIQREGLQRGLDHAYTYFKKGHKRKRTTRAQMQERMQRVTGSLDYHGLGSADVVIEAVYESLELKQQMVQAIEARAGDREVIFASNTSALPIASIAEAAEHPERVIGMHFFSPVEKMPLVEIIVTDQTAPEVTAKVSRLARRMGKHVIVVRDGPGFYTTRILAPYMTEAMFLLLEGADPLLLDEAAQDVGFPVGPVTLLDEVGIDVGTKVTGIMEEHFGDRLEFPDHRFGERFVADGRLGRKSSKGFYLYQDGVSKTSGGKKMLDPSVRDYLPHSKGTPPPPTEIQQRLLLSLVNEAVWCLEEGILREPRAGDLGAVMGIGFPPFEGGPFCYADRLGIPKLVARLQDLEERIGRRFAPCPRLLRMAEQGERFYP